MDIRRVARTATIRLFAWSLALAPVPAFADPAPAPPAPEEVRAAAPEAAPDKADKRELSEAEKAEIRASIPRLKPFRPKAKSRELAVALASR